MSRTAFEWSQWTPPDPPSLDNTESKDGQKLLSLIRFMEKEEDEKEFEIKYEEAFNMFTNLIALSARHGILRGNYQRAEQILASTSTTGDNNRQGRPKNKKNRRKDDRKPDEKFTGESVSTDESLLISALLRIFALQGEKLKAMKPFVKLAADFCSSIADRLKAIPNITSSTVALAEYELMASSGVSLLRALAKINAVLLSDSTSQKEQDFKAIQILLGEIPAVDQRDEDIQILQSCLRATTTLISLFGTKLSRSTGLISDIRTVAWSTLTLPEEATQSAAAKLLATLPLAGAATSGDRSNPNAILSPAEQWSQALMDAVVAVSTLLKTMVPVSRKMSSEQASWDLTDGAKSVVEGSTAFFQQNLTSDEKIRCRAFRFLIGGFSSLILALLQRDYHGPGNEVSLLDTRICFDELLELLGTMLLFPSSSESLFYITKKRLRMEMMEGGVLSPMAIATEIGNPIKLHGHKVLHALFSALGGPVLLPYAKHLLRVVSASLFTSCSGPLRKVVDPVSTSQLEGTKRRWLHTSISLRSESIRTFTEAVSSFGLEPTRSSGEGSSWTSSKRSSNSEQCITLVGGCLLEQLTWEGEDTDDWGTLSERITLA